MSFQKQVLVLKDVCENTCHTKKSLVGIARIEIDNGVAELFLSLVNVPYIARAKYCLLVIDFNQTVHSFDLGASPISTIKTFENLPVIEKGVAVGIYAVKDQIPLTVAFSKTEDSTFSLSQFKKTVAERQLERIKQRRQKERESVNDCERPSVKQEQENTFSIYNDEAVATENYFDYEQGEKMSSKKDFEVNAPIKNELFNNTSTQKAQQEHPHFNCVQNETNACSSTQNSQKLYHFERAKQELENIFSKFPEETPLQKLFADSKWAKINYSKDKYYVVGLIKENGKEKYICYGVPAVYSPTPPEQLKGYCSFVPQSIFNMTGQGYWMLFQDACSGKCVLHE